MADPILDKFFPIILRHNPNIQIHDIIPYYDGHDHYVLVVHNKIAYRFPRTDEHGEKDKEENKFLSEFSGISPVAVQVLTSQNDSESGIEFQTYDFISGSQLTQEFAKIIPQDKLLAVAKEMGNFLKVLHVFPISRAKEMGVYAINAAEYPKWFKEFLEKDREAIFKYLALEEQAWVEKKFEDYLELSKGHTFEVKMTHSDLLPEHIIVDKDTFKLNGIIDFSTRIADPANDFKYFDRYGKEFLETVYESYGEVDENFDKRRVFYAANLLVNNLFQANRVGKPELIEKARKELTDYITQDK